MRIDDAGSSTDGQKIGTLVWGGVCVAAIAVLLACIAAWTRGPWVDSQSSSQITAWWTGWQAVGTLALAVGAVVIAIFQGRATRIQMDRLELERREKSDREQAREVHERKEATIRFARDVGDAQLERERHMETRLLNDDGSPLNPEQVEYVNDDPDMRQTVQGLLNEYERLAVGISVGVFHVDTAYQLFGTPFRSTWTQLLPYVELQQTQQADVYAHAAQLYATFESLASGN